MMMHETNEPGEETRVSTIAYLTLSDGTLVDVERVGETVTLRAGASLSPAERPILVALDLDEARELAWALHAFTSSAIDAAALDRRAAELAADVADDTRGPLTLVLRPALALYVAAFLHYAVRQPELQTQTPGSVRAVQTVIDHLRHYFTDAPRVLALLGDDDE